MKLSKIAPLLLPLGLFGFAFKIYLDSQNRPDISGETQEYRDKVEQAKTQNRTYRKLDLTLLDTLPEREQTRFEFDVNELRRRRDERRAPVDAMADQTLPELGNFEKNAVDQWDVMRQLYQGYGQEYQEKSRDAAEIKERFAAWHTRFVDMVAEPGGPGREELLVEVKQFIADGSNDPYVQYCRCECEHQLVDVLPMEALRFVNQVEEVGYSGLMRSEFLHRMREFHKPNAGAQEWQFLLTLCTESVRDAVVECTSDDPDRVWLSIQEALAAIPLQNVEWVFAHSMEALPKDHYLLYMVGGYTSYYRGIRARSYDESISHLHRASMYFHSAWLMDPDKAAAVHSLIRFSGFGKESDWSMRDWFNVSMAMDATHKHSYWQYLRKLQGREWTGEAPEQTPVEFARECLASDRFDCGVPNFYFEVLFSELNRGRNLLDGPEAERDLIDAVDRVERWLQTEEGKSSDTNNLREQRASMLVLLLRQGNWTDARRLCRMLPGFPLLTNPEQMLTDYEKSREILSAVNHDGGEPLVYVEEKFGRNVFGDNSPEATQLAIDRVATFAKRGDLSESDQEYVAYRMSVLEAERDYQLGKPTILPLTGDNPLWHFPQPVDLTPMQDNCKVASLNAGGWFDMVSTVALDPPFVVRTTVQVIEPLPDVQVNAENGTLGQHDFELHDSLRSVTPIPGPKPLDPTEQLGHFDLPISEDELQLEIRVTAETYSLFIDGELTEEKPMDTLSRVNIAFETTFDSVFGPITVERMPPGDEEQSG